MPLLENICTRADELIILSNYRRDDSDIKLQCNTINITCRRCGSDQIHQSQKQTRAADEAATNIYLCLNCGYTWRTV